MAFSKNTVNGVPLTADNFAHPPHEMGIIPFWFWNGEMDEKEMEWQLREYYDKGIRGLFIHGRFGLKVPYVSDAWFDKVKVAVELAKKIGIDAWVYDEMNWPSGTAERKVPTQYPHLTQKYLELVALNVDGPLFTFLEATDNRYVNTGDSYPVAAYGCTEAEFQTAITSPIDLTLNLSFERVIPWEAPAGKWRLLYFLQKEVPYYIDTLNPESTKRFLELTHERYKEAVGEHFGSVVPGFYTDEPAMHYYHVGIDNYVIPWTSQMFKIFREKRGYDLRPWLPALYLNMGEKTAAVRYDFWRTLTEQYAETYYGQIRTWCEKQGVLFTGHLLFEEWIRMHARCEGNLFEYLKKFHLIGVDHLYPKVGTEKEPDQHVALKIASSAAHHFGSTRLLCESMGGSYWDCTLERMKWIANWEYVLGVNLFNNHGYHYSIEGERKRDWPPSQFYHHTWWKHYDRFTTYMSRLSHLLSGGTHVAKILVLYPINSIWANYVPQHRTDVGNVIEGDFNYLTDALMRMHYDFDFVDESVLAEASVKQGKVHIRDEAYDVILLPPVTHLKKTTFDVLKDFVAKGGALIGDTLLPVEFLESAAPHAATEVRKTFGVDPSAILSRFEKGTAPVRWNVRKGPRGRVFFLEGKGLNSGTGKAALAKVLRQCVVPDVTVSDGDVFYLHRVKDGHDIYFFANTSQEIKSNVEITFEKSGVPELWNVNTGAMEPVQIYDIVKKRLVLHLNFPAAESHVVVLKADAPESHVVSTNLRLLPADNGSLRGSSGEKVEKAFAVVAQGKTRRRIAVAGRKPLRPLPLPREWDFSLEGDNAFLIDRFKMLIEEKSNGQKKSSLADLDDSQWLRVKPGAWEMQLPQERDVTTYPVPLWYRAEFNVRYVPSNVRILIDGFSGSGYRLFVNGEEVVEKGTRSSLDAEIKEINIHHLVREGKNVIAVFLMATRRTDGLLDPLKLVGDFAVEGTPDGLTIVQRPKRLHVGDWTKQGFPFFSGTGVYSTRIAVPAGYVGGRLELSADCGDDVLEVHVNGKEAGVAPWHPYTIDLTGALVAGENDITIKVTNTLINVLEGVQRASGLLGLPALKHEQIYTLKNSRGDGTKE